ncbi:Por secretion system C-terminal sorting domain-containing protein [Chitinophaga sp. CF118]|uniref:sugar-binding protein n=1 Tax=Chitinophaga sp. CF118 TaxID=1884367 RepID=UPI0008E2FEF5|nr:sugar-binding protein [Chitinophaga sp. CF118]SFD77441.1 Por secretion system C-terminal sorting domain-containing protein [Chitinophaga sp. CF118]
MRKTLSFPSNQVHPGIPPDFPNNLRKVPGWLTTLLLLFLLSNAHAQSDGLPRGAYQLPYIRYESDNAILDGGAALQQSPQFIQTDIASEASDQKYVSLTANGASIEWTATQAAQGVNLRFTLPDDNTGAGLTGSLGLYVNGVKVKTIPLSSYWAYQYFPQADPVQTPGGKTFMRFDEVHFRLDNPINIGNTISIRKDNSDAITYGVDFIELEPVPAALTQPANYLSVTAYGAVANDQTDDFAAFNACIAAAASQGKNVYIPAGKFLLSDKLPLNVSNMKILGAGVWYTEVYFSTDKQFYGGIMGRASNVEISNFSLNTINNDRLKYDEANPRLPGEMYKTYKGFMGTYGAGSRIHDIWVEHFECGFWIAGYDPPYPIDITTDLVISKCRIRNNYADGVNFCQGTSNSVVEQSSVRNNGDDGLAVWPANAAGNNQTCRNNIFRYNTIENNWRAGSIALFGGTGHEIHHNLIKDGVAGSAIRFTNDFPGFTFEYPGDVIKVYENTMSGCGSSYDLWDQKRGAVEFYAGGSGIFNMQFDNNTILRSQRDAIQIYGNGIHHLVFNNTTIDGTGLDPVVRNEPADVYGGFGLYVQAGSQTATFNNLTVTNAESGAYINKNNSFQLIIQNINIPVSSVSIKPANDTTLTTGQTLQLTANILPVDATNKNVTWTSSNAGAATVDASGKVTAVGYGIATITVVTASGNFTATRKVTIQPGVNVVATTPAAAEGGAAGVFTFSTSSLSSTISVKYTVSGTASGSDYTPSLNGTITLTPTNPSATITITPVDDVVFEGPETLRISLKKDSAYNLGGDTTAVITIADNDNPPCVAPVIALVSGTAPVIDQSIDAAWAIAPVKNISNVILGSLPSDYAGKWRALYDNTNLYLLVEVNDGTKLSDSGASWWEDDVVEIFIDGDNSKGTAYDGINDFQLGFRWNDNTVHVGSYSVNRTTGINYNQYATATGYTLEVAIPWSTIGVSPSIGKSLGLDVQIDDDDNGGTRDAQIASFATNTTAFQNPAVFGTVYLTTCNGVVNQPPTVNAGTDQTLAANTTSVTLQGNGSDPEGHAVTYSWTKVSGPAVTFSSTTIANPVVTGLTNGSTYVFQLTVSDGTLTSADQVQISIGSVSNPADLTAYPGTVTVDGNLNESSWNLSKSIAKTTVGTPNNTATFGVLWDNNNLYIGVKVLDATLNNDSPDSWDNDAVEIFIDANNNKGSTFDGRDNQFIKAYNSSTLFSKIAVTGVQHAYATITGGYTVEISIPWSQLGITPAAGLTIGFDAGYDDDDNGGSRDGQAVWFGTINNYQSTADYGTLVLANTALNTLAVEHSVVSSSDLKIVPNPAINGQAKVLISGNTAKGYIYVYDLHGKQVYTTKALPEVKLDLQQLPKGVYVVKYIIGDKSFTRKLLIQ